MRRWLAVSGVTGLTIVIVLRVNLILAAATRRRLAGLDYEFERLKALVLELELTTVDLVWRDRDDLYHVRNPFPVGGVYEDPATGAAAAAFGGYLRALGLIARRASGFCRARIWAVRV